MVCLLVFWWVAGDGGGGVATAADAGGSGIVAAEVAPGPSGNEAADSLAREVQLVFERCKEAVAKIEAMDCYGHLAGTGFFIDPEGILLTSYTIGGETTDIAVTFGGRCLPATRLLADGRSGIAILKVDARTPFLTTGVARELPVAAPVILIGYALDLPVSPTFGVVAGMDIKYLGRCFSTAHLRANLPVHRGQGGAPLLNLKGDVVGVVISSIDAGGGCFALPMEAAEKVRRDFARFGEVRPGWIGVAVSAADPAADGARVRVDGFIEGSPAADSGLQAGDLLLAVDGRPVSSPEDVLDAAFFLTAGDRVPLTVARHGESSTVTVAAALHPTVREGETAQLPPADHAGKGVLLRCEP